MSEMSILERVAKAHWEARRSGFSIPRMDLHEVMEWSELPEDFRQKEIAATRAAIASMRDPTQEMLEAMTEGFGKEPDRNDSTPHYLQRQRNALAAFVDAALK